MAEDEPTPDLVAEFYCENKQCETWSTNSLVESFAHMDLQVGMFTSALMASPNHSVKIRVSKEFS